MARQTGGLTFRGTLNGLTYYRLNGKWLVRRKSSLDRARVMRDPAFARSQVCAGRFGVAAGIAGHIYRMLPRRKRRHGLIGRLTGMANRLLFAGESQETVREKLLRHVLGPSAADKLLEAVSFIPVRGARTGAHEPRHEPGMKTSGSLNPARQRQVSEARLRPVSRQYAFALGVP